MALICLTRGALFAWPAASNAHMIKDPRCVPVTSIRKRRLELIMQPRAPTKAYVNELEQRVKKLEGMLEEVCG
jgi:hypothetical protein